MGQRVNIQYSVELDDLDEEVNRLFGKAIKELDLAAPVGGTPRIKLGNDGFEQLDFLRRKLAKIDIMLGDVQNIIEGYVNYKSAPPPQRQPDSPSEAEEMEVEHLEDKIAKFKEILNENTDQKSHISN